MLAPLDCGGFAVPAWPAPVAGEACLRKGAAGKSGSGGILARAKMPETPPSPPPVPAQLRQEGYAFLSAADAQALPGVALPELDRLRTTWEHLPLDSYLRDGGRYRSRRHSCFIQVLSPPALTLVPQRAHWQPTLYNALHGGIERWYEPVETAVLDAAVWRALVAGLGALFAQVRATPRWYIEAHQFRIDTSGGIGRPTPEGAHRDGVDFVAVILVDRAGVRGGETHVFDAHGPSGVRFTMQEPWSMLLLDDARVIHETTPIQPQGRTGGARGHRDTLVLTYRAGGFQEPAAS